MEKLGHAESTSTLGCIPAMGKWSYSLWSWEKIRKTSIKILYCSDAKPILWLLMLAPDASNAAILTSASITDLKLCFLCGEVPWLVLVLSWLLCWCWLRLPWRYLRLHNWASPDQLKFLLVAAPNSKINRSNTKPRFLRGCSGLYPA